MHGNGPLAKWTAFMPARSCTYLKPESDSIFFSVADKRQLSRGRLVSMEAEWWLRWSLVALKRFPRNLFCFFRHLLTKDLSDGCSSQFNPITKLYLLHTGSLARTRPGCFVTCEPRPSTQERLCHCQEHRDTGISMNGKPPGHLYISSRI